MYQGYNPAAEAWYGARLILKSLWNGNSAFLPKIRTMIDSICCSLRCLLFFTTFQNPINLLPPMVPSTLSLQLHHLSWQLRRIGHPETASLYPGKNLNTLMGSYWTMRSNTMKRWGDHMIRLGCVGKEVTFSWAVFLQRNEWHC